MIRLGGDIAGVLARLGEKTLGMVEGVPMLLKTLASPSST
jgi:hypothetical protein